MAFIAYHSEYMSIRGTTNAQNIHFSYFPLSDIILTCLESIFFIALDGISSIPAHCVPGLSRTATNILTESFVSVSSGLASGIFVANRRFDVVDAWN